MSAYQEARSLGYSDDDILKHFSEKDPQFSSKYQTAISEGYTPEQIFDFVGKVEKPITNPNIEKSPFETPGSTARNAMQATIGGAQGVVYGLGALGPFLADIAYPGAVQSEISEQKYSPLEEPEFFPEASKRIREETQVPFDIETIQKSASDMEQKVFGKEGFTTGLMTLPYRAFGIETEPKDTSESISRGTAALLAGYQSAKPISHLSLPITKGQQIRQLSVAVPSALAASSYGQLAQDTYGVGGRIVAETILFGGAAVAKKGYDLVKWASGKFSKFLEKIPFNAAQTAEKAMSPQQQEMVAPYLKIAEKHNIPVSIGTLSDSPYVRAAEEEIAKSNLTTKQANQFREDSARVWGGLYDNFLIESAEASRYESPGAVALHLKESVVNPAEKKIIDNARRLYGESIEGFKNAKPIPASDIQQIEDSLNGVISKLDESLIPTSTEEGAKGIAQRAKSALTISPAQVGKPQFEDVNLGVGTAEKLLLQQSKTEVAERQGRAAMMRAEGRNARAAEVTQEERRKAQLKVNKMFGKDADKVVITEDGKIQFRKDISPANIIATVRSLNDRLSWDQPEVINLMKPTRAVIKEILKKNYAKTHGVALSKYELANEQFGKGAELFFGDGAKYKKWAINSDATPETLANELNSIAKFEQFTKDFGGNPEGKMLIDYLKRKKLDTQLRDVFDRLSGTYLPGAVSGRIRTLEQNQFVKYLAGDKWTQFKEIAALDQFLLKNTTKIYSSGIPTETIDQFFSGLKLATALVSSPKVGIPAAAFMWGKKMAKGNYLGQVATFYENPSLMREAIDIAKHANDWGKEPEFWGTRMKQLYKTISMQSEVNNLSAPLRNSKSALGPNP